MTFAGEMDSLADFTNTGQEALVGLTVDDNYLEDRAPMAVDELSVDDAFEEKEVNALKRKLREALTHQPDRATPPFTLVDDNVVISQTEGAQKLKERVRRAVVDPDSEMSQIACKKEWLPSLQKYLAEHRVGSIDTHGGLQPYKVDGEESHTPLLHEQFGLKATQRLRAKTVLGQLLASEWLLDEYEDHVDETGEWWRDSGAIHAYVWDPAAEVVATVVFDSCELVPKLPGKNVLHFINDARVDILSAGKPTDAEVTRINVELFTAKLDGWPATFVITTREVKKGEVLLARYPRRHRGTVVPVISKRMAHLEDKVRLALELVDGMGE